jgi:hypothetical protein
VEVVPTQADLIPFGWGSSSVRLALDLLFLASLRGFTEPVVSIFMWEVQLYGRIEQADLATLQLWLLNGRITSATLVRFGEQPWIPAQEVPELKQMCVATLGEEHSATAKARLPHIAPGDESQRQRVIHDILAGRATAGPASQAPSGQVLTPVVTCQGGPWTGFRYTIKASGFENRHIEVKGMTFLSFPKVFMDGEPAPRGAKRGTWSLRSNDGRDVELQVRSWVWTQCRVYFSMEQKLSSNVR